MSEQLIRESIAEANRQKERVEDANRFGRIEGRQDVQRTLFDALVKRIEEWMARAVTGENLATLKREMEAEMNGTVTQIREHVSTANEAQATNILSRVEAMLTAYRMEAKDEQIASANRILAAISERRSKALWWVLGIVGSVIASVAGTIAVIAVIGN